jgi:hypothetical protein
MNPQDQAKLYADYFGPPVLIAKGIVNTPPVSVHVFTNDDKSEHVHLTLGMDEPGYRELLMLTKKQERWPAYFLQALCRYQLQYKEQFAEEETFDNAAEIPQCNGFDKALFLSIDLFGMDKKEITKALGLKRPPLYVFPITNQEFDFALKHGTPLLLEKIAEKVDPIADINRQNTIVETPQVQPKTKQESSKGKFLPANKK